MTVLNAGEVDSVEIDGADVGDLWNNIILPTGYVASVVANVLLIVSGGGGGGSGIGSCGVFVIPPDPRPFVLPYVQDTWMIPECAC